MLKQLPTNQSLDRREGYSCKEALAPDYQTSPVLDRVL